MPKRKYNAEQARTTRKNNRKKKQLCKTLEVLESRIRTSMQGKTCPAVNIRFWKEKDLLHMSSKELKSSVIADIDRYKRVFKEIQEIPPPPNARKTNRKYEYSGNYRLKFNPNAKPREYKRQDLVQKMASGTSKWVQQKK